MRDFENRPDRIRMILDSIEMEEVNVQSVSGARTATSTSTIPFPGHDLHYDPFGLHYRGRRALP